MRERAQVLGSRGSLVSVVTEPSGAPAPGAPAVILLNAGVIHRVGPNRLYVQIARSLAAVGCVALRFDLSGRGDSDVRPDAVSHTEADLLEVQEAMTHLEHSKGIRTFVLMGICSGAALSFQTAWTDPRVVGIVAIDSYVYPTLGFHLRYYARRLFSASSWRNTLAGRNALGRRLRGGWGRKKQPSDGDEMMGPFSDSSVPSKETVAHALRDVVARHVALLMIFSGGGTGGGGLCNYRGQFADAFSTVDFKDRLRVEYIPSADHTFTLLSNQTTLVGLIRTWMETAFLAASRPS